MSLWQSQQGDEYDILDASDEDDDDAPGIATMDPHFVPSGLRLGPGHAERPTPAHDPMDVDDDDEDEADDESEDLEDAELADYS